MQSLEHQKLKTGMPDTKRSQQKPDISARNHQPGTQQTNNKQIFFFLKTQKKFRSLEDQNLS